MVEKEFTDILGRVIKIDDILVYCSPFDGMHFLYVTLKDPDGTLYVSKLKADGIYDGEEYLEAFDHIYIPPESGLYGKLEFRRSLKQNIKISRRCFPISLFSGYIVLRGIRKDIKLSGAALSRLC